MFELNKIYVTEDKSPGLEVGTYVVDKSDDMHYMEDGVFKNSFQWNETIYRAVKRLDEKTLVFAFSKDRDKVAKLVDNL